MHFAKDSATRAELEDRPGIGRRKFLLGGIAAASVAGTATAALSLAADDALDRLIEAHKAVRVREDIVCKRCWGELDSEQWKAAMAANAAEHEKVDAALSDLLSYQPRDMAEVRRRSDYLLTEGSWLPFFGPTPEQVTALFLSMATLPADVAWWS